MKEFNICHHCGYRKDFHPFRHIIDKKINVKIIDGVFRVDAEDFPSFEKDSKCTVVGCGASKLRHHDSTVPEEKRYGIKHLFSPPQDIVRYRKISITIPMNTLCSYSSCRIPLKHHKKEMTHLFHTKVEIKNLNSEDLVKLIDERDDEIKIINSL